MEMALHRPISYEFSYFGHQRLFRNKEKNQETELSFCSVTFFATAQIPADHFVSFWVEIFS